MPLRRVLRNFPMPSLDLPIRAATETALAHGVVPDRCDILQNASTLVLRLSESLVARVLTDLDGPRQGGEWFARENAVALHLAGNDAPVIPLHPDLPPGPYEHLGYALNFWQFVTQVPGGPSPESVGRTLQHCHRVLATYKGDLPELAILTESVDLLGTLRQRGLFPEATLDLLRGHLTDSLDALAAFPGQALHGDAHSGNLLNTTLGLLWTDWEDTFRGPVEWDLASIIWNARILEEDHATADRILDAYRAAGGTIDAEALHHSLIGRAAVMTAWYPILYSDQDVMRQDRLRFRIGWLEKIRRQG